ncbi:MAG: hypothetical protein CL773_03190 [Chloroflexi bacterium]|nr:hypothetical protein [Chloroflexota bacterium]|tara:strand:+ start:183 stop:863 length:681 start_codon:yes stop_codon:yes gene_type:complete
MKPSSIFNLFKKIAKISSSTEDYTQKLISSGVKIIDSKSVYIDDSVEISPGSVIYPSVYLIGKTRIASNCTIGPNTTISNSSIGCNSIIMSSVVLDSSVGKNNEIGPFAFIRESSVTEENVVIGNFVEVKSSKIGKNSKSKHLSYIGDAEISKNVNVGAGFVMANFDGKNKNKSIVEDNVFIGSNSTIISPVVIRNNAIIGAGSVVNKDILPGDKVAGKPARSLRN